MCKGCMKIKPERMNSEIFTGYGQYINGTNMKKNNNDDYIYLRELGIFEDKEISIGYLTAYKRDGVFKSMERHKYTQEMLVVLSGSGTMLFAKPSDDPNDGIVALQVRAGDAFIMLPATWHGLILPEDCESVDLLVVFKRGTEDNDIEMKNLNEEVCIY